MKKILAIALAAIMFTSCGFLKGTTTTPASSTTTTPATATSGVTTGKAAGLALDALTTQYKTTGTIDCSNITNLLNIAQVVAACKELKSNKGNADYTKSFTQGLVLSSVNVDELNKETITDKLTSLVDNVDTTALNNSITNAVNTGKEKAAAASEKVANAAATATNVANEVNEVANSITTILSLFAAK